MQMHMIKQTKENNDYYSDHTLIVNEIERSIKFNNLDFILSFLPKGSFLVGGYIRDIILGRLTAEVDVDIVVPSNSLGIGKKISDHFKCKFIVLDQEREVVRIIINQISIDIAKQISPSIEGDLKKRDFSINSIAFLFDQKLLIDPLDGIGDIKFSLIKTYSEINILDDPLRILRCFRIVSELNFNIDDKLIIFINKLKSKLNNTAKERINYEIQKIIRGLYAPNSIKLMKQFNILGSKNLYKGFISKDLEKINFEELNYSEKKKFLPLFFMSQILDAVSLEKLRFSKSEILNTKLIQKWNLTLYERNISHLNELERFELHKELEDILPSFIFYLPQNFRSEWINRWRDKGDKLFHPSNLINGNEIKKHLNINDGPHLGMILNYLSKELAYGRLNNFDEAIYKAKQWSEQNAPKCD